MYMNAGNAAYNVSTAFTRLNVPELNLLHCDRGKLVVLTYLLVAPPMFFMNIITSDVLNLSRVSVPIVSCVLPYT